MRNCSTSASGASPAARGRRISDPLHLLTDRIVDLADVLGPDALRLESRLAEAADWPSRFALLDAFIAARIAAAAPLSAVLLEAWRWLERCDGRIPVARIASELDVSRKQLSVRFREEIGLPPRTVARLMRFRCALERLSAGAAARWSEIALDSGYYDQAHLIRDFRRFAGMTPTQFLRCRIADGSGVIDDLGLA
jgi:AraC-like DNA-binding protein